jgi:hypothetical protein
MKYTKFYFLGFILFWYSCASKETKFSIYKYSLEARVAENFILNTREKDSLMLYEYTTAKDSVLPNTYSYLADKEMLKFKSRTFVSTGMKYRFDNYVFIIYQEKTVQDTAVTLVFNKDYGLFASLGFGENFIFTKEEMLPKIEEYNFKRLFRSLNSVRTE